MDRIAFPTDLETANEEIAIYRAENERLRAALRSVVNHWNEFGPERGLDEIIHAASMMLADTQA